MDRDVTLIPVQGWKAVDNRFYLNADDPESGFRPAAGLVPLAMLGGGLALRKRRRWIRRAGKSSWSCRWPCSR